MVVSRKIRAGRALLMLFLFLSGVVVWDQIQTWQEEKTLWQTEASTSSADNDTVLLGGMPVGIYMETDGVMVLNTEKIEGIDGIEHDPAAEAVQTGDYITAVNHHEISGKADLLEAVDEIDGSDVVLTLRRGENTMDIEIRRILGGIYMDELRLERIPLLVAEHEGHGARLDEIDPYRREVEAYPLLSRDLVPALQDIALRRVLPRMDDIAHGHHETRPPDYLGGSVDIDADPGEEIFRAHHHRVVVGSGHILRIAAAIFNRNDLGGRLVLLEHEIEQSHKL